MPDFDVTFTRVITFYGKFTIKAKNEDTAEEKTTALIEEALQTPLNWTFKYTTKALKEIEWEEHDDIYEDVDIQEL